MFYSYFVLKHSLAQQVRRFFRLLVSALLTNRYQNFSFIKNRNLPLRICKVKFHWTVLDKPKVSDDGFLTNTTPITWETRICVVKDCLFNITSVVLLFYSIKT
jgi:hypothetical protein